MNEKIRRRKRRTRKKRRDLPHCFVAAGHTSSISIEFPAKRGTGAFAAKVIGIWHQGKKADLGVELADPVLKRGS